LAWDAKKARRNIVASFGAMLGELMGMAGVLVGAMVVGALLFGTFMLKAIREPQQPGWPRAVVIVGLKGTGTRDRPIRRAVRQVFYRYMSSPWNIMVLAI
ncbi:MAG TPA: hypothetical protein VMR25_20340, partial [Planctomycetaceae bacterium]|nr:hypothetical protein [Planctomycetaceae bacterium]